MKDFKTLYERYLNNQASDEEVAELMHMIAEGRHDNLIREDFYNAFLKSSGTEGISSEHSKQLLATILKKAHENPARVISGKSTRRWVASAASIVVLCLTGLWLYNRVTLSSDLDEESKGVTRNSTLTKSESLKNQSTTYTGKQFVKLPDGSTVMLDDNSKLTHTVDFNGTLREVSLEGKAYFDIAHNPEKPFKVHTGEYVTTVLGTAFNINYDADLPACRQGEVIVTVTRGKVAVGKGEKVYELLTPDHEIAINTNTDHYTTHQVKAEEVVAWQKDYFVLDNVTMQAAVDQIAQRFDVSIEIENSGLKNCKVSAWFINHETLDEVLEFITLPRDAEFELMDVKNGERSRTIIITGGNGCNEK